MLSNKRCFSLLALSLVHVSKVTILMQAEFYNNYIRDPDRPMPLDSTVRSAIRLNVSAPKTPTSDESPSGQPSPWGQGNMFGRGKLLYIYKSLLLTLPYVMLL